MSVIIKDMEVPQCCGDCHIGFCKQIGCDLYIGFDDYATSRHPDCPIRDVPPHGRLIDEEAVIDHFVNLSNNEWNQNVCTSWANAFAEAAGDICDIPTIIEAEEGEP